jgi:hypothetical protein
MKEINGIDYLCNDDTKNAAVFFINDISEELKTIIRDNFSKISYGDAQVSDDEIGYYDYKRTLKSFLENYDKKNGSPDLQKGMIGELLSNILIRNYKDSLECISVYFNKEENHIKKGYDIAYYDSDFNCIRYSEVKSGEKNAKETADIKTDNLLEKSKKDIITKFNDVRKKLWDSALVDARLVISNQTKLKFINNILKKDQINNEKDERKYSVILISVLFSDINDKLNYTQVIDFLTKVNKEGLFENVMVFSIQKNTYEKVSDFLRSELND